MHLPKPFEVTDSRTIDEFIDARNFGELISQVDGRLFVSPLPFLFDNKRQLLYCHMARSNPQWKEIESQQVLVTFQGPHGYVSPTWYKNPGVPTWNYQTVHVYGRCRRVEDPESLKTLVDQLTEKHELAFETPWQPDYDAKLLGGIVGLEITIEEKQGKFKLSQNRSKEDQLGVLENMKNPDLIKQMKDANQLG